MEWIFQTEDLADRSCYVGAGEGDQIRKAAAQITIEGAQSERARGDEARLHEDVHDSP